MILKIDTSTCKGELFIVDEADIHEYMDVIVGALIAEGFNIEIIANGLRSKLNSIGDLPE